MKTPSFKDLLSKSDLDGLKSLAPKSRSQDASLNEKANPSVALPSTKATQSVAKRLGQGVDEDQVLFMQAMAGVAPIKSSNAHHIARPRLDDPSAPTRRAYAQGEEGDRIDGLSDMQALMNPIAPEAILSYKVPTLQNKTFADLKAGKMRWYDVLDLHGASIDEARTALVTLIKRAHQAGESVVKVVHGKGIDAILKTCVNGWLRQMDSVLAFTSAPTKDGGNGAVLVLLKRKKDAV